MARRPSAPERAEPLPFEAFAKVEGQRLLRALTASHGPDRGADLHADAMAKAWAEWDRIGAMANPAGYLWRVAHTENRRYDRWDRWDRRPRFPGRCVLTQPDITDVDLFLCLGGLTRPQPVAVVMVHAHQAIYQEVAELLDVPVTTVTNLVHRGLRRLRHDLKEQP